jgi:DNA-directed RNA polymerase subunit RPC12/RpoP
MQFHFFTMSVVTNILSHVANKLNGQSLLEARPDLAKEADGWDPQDFLSKSGKVVAWICSLGHRYSAKIYSRANGSGCPVCAGKVVHKGFNDLETLHPDVASWAEGWDPGEFRPYSRQKKLWKCTQGHIFEQTIEKQLRFKTCPYCTHRRVLAGFSDLLTIHPEIAKLIKNRNPKEIMANSNQIVEFECDLRHTWKASVGDVVRGNRCPYCSGKRVLKGFNDLATKNPMLAQEAYGWDPSSLTGASGKVRKWKCKEGHIWNAAVNNRNRIKGSNCPSCSKSGYDPNKEGWLYFIEHPLWEMLQIGITNNPDLRLRDHKRLGWNLLEIRGPMNGHQAQRTESSILRMLRAKKADLANSLIAGKFDGYSEAWSKSTFEVNSIKKLMEITEIYERSIRDSSR